MVTTNISLILPNIVTFIVGNILILHVRRFESVAFNLAPSCPFNQKFSCFYCHE